MNIDGLGEKKVETFHEAGLLNGVEDIYHLNEHQQELMSIDKMGSKSCDNLFNAIEESKKSNLDKLLFGLGIRQIGAKAATILAKNFQSMDKLRQATIEQLTEISDIGPIMADNIVSFFKDEKNIELIENLKSLGVNMIYDSGKTYTSIFTNRTVVLTGSLQGITRSQASAYLEQLQAKVSSSVSSKTDFVIYGTDPGSKYDKAVKLDVQLVDEEAFLKELLRVGLLQEN